MRVLLLAAADSVHNEAVLQMLLESGIDARMLSFAAQTVTPPANPSRTDQLNRFPGMIIPNLLPSYASLLSQIRKWKPDILHAVFVTTYGLLGAASGFHPFVAMPMASDILLEPKRSVIARLSVQVVGKQADLILCDSEIVREGYLRVAASVESKIRPFCRGVDTEVYKPGAKLQELEERWRTKGRVVILSTRWLKPGYSLDTLVQAVTHLGPTASDVLVVVVGSGTAERTLREMVSSVGLQDFFRFVGRVEPDAMPDFYRLADIYVSTSPSDGTSISLLEAMSSGLPVVAADSPGNAPWIRKGVTGYTFEPGDSHQLSEKIRLLLADSGMRLAMGNAGRELVVREADRASARKRLLSLYAELVDRRR